MKINSRCSTRRASDGQSMKDKNLASTEIASRPRTWRNSALSILNVGSSLKSLIQKHVNTTSQPITNLVFDLSLWINNSEKWYDVEIRW